VKRAGPKTPGRSWHASAFIVFFIIIPTLPGSAAPAEAATVVAALLAAATIPAGVFFRSGRAGLRNIYLAAQSWNLDKRHGALLLKAYVEF
jgi:hypothetical protein